MKTIHRYLGYLLIISAFFRIIPIVTGLIYGEQIWNFVISAFVSLIIGILLVVFFNQAKKNKPISIKEGFILAGISFIFIPLIGSISFLPIFNYNFTDAFFESVSGFTTTGLTLFSNISELPKSLLIWRAETQWLGGIGVIMFFLFLVSYFGRVGEFKVKDSKEIQQKAQSRIALYQSHGFGEKLEGGFRTTLVNIMIIFFSYTVVGIILLYLSGMNLFESVALTFTSLSTGGFTVTDKLEINTVQMIILCILMIIGATSFIAHNKLLKKQFKEFFFSYEKNLLILFIIIATAIAFIYSGDFQNSVFHIVSAITTTGYSMTEIQLLPHIFILLIFVGMIFGGSTSSTAGGLKIGRVYTMLRAVPWYIKKKMSPTRAVIPLKVHGKNIDEDHLIGIGVFLFVYIIFLIGGTIIFMLFGYGFLDSSFQITSALGTVGLSTMSLYVLPSLLKIILIFAMIFGRLEIFPLLIVLKQLFDRNKK